MPAAITSPCDEGVIRTTPASAPCRPGAEPWILATTILASSMAFIDGTVVNVALPALQKEFDAGVSDAQWVIEAYALLLTALLLAGGSAGDLFGRRRVFAIGVAVFALASAWCGLAGSMPQLIFARAVQGAGAALLVPGSLALISASFPENTRGKAIGTWSGYTAITAALGPVLGGFLIERLSWRYAFFLNLPLALAVLFLAFRHVPESRREGARDRPERLDWPGAVLASAGLAGLVYGLIEAPVLGWRNAAVIAALVSAPVILAGFVLAESRQHAPMLPLALFRSRDFSGANLLTLLLYAALGGAMFFIPLDLIQVQGYSATAAGAALLPLILLMFALSHWAGGLVDRHGAKLPLTIGPAVAALGFALLAVPGIGGGYWTTFFPPMLVLGLGMATTVAPLTTTVMNAVGTGASGIASGVNNAVSRAAALLAIAVLGIVMSAAFRQELPRSLAQAGASPAVARQVLAQQDKLAAIELPPQADEAGRRAARTAVDRAFLHGFRRVMLACALLALASSLCAWLLIGSPRRGREDDGRAARR